MGNLSDLAAESRASFFRLAKSRRLRLHEKRRGRRVNRATVPGLDNDSQIQRLVA